MSVDVRAPGRASVLPAIPLRRRLYGFGSIYGKTVRDSRLAFLIVTGVLAGMMLAAGAAIGTMFPTPASRLQVDVLIESIPSSMSGLFGNPVKVNTLGGMTSWKYGPFFVLGTGFWSILALSATLAGEARRGSLDLVAAAPFGKRRIALEKVAGHLTMLGLTMAILAFSSWATAAIFGDAALGDEIRPMRRSVSRSGSACSPSSWGPSRSRSPRWWGVQGRRRRRRRHAAGLRGRQLRALRARVRGHRQALLGSAGPTTTSRWAAQYDWPSLGLVALVAVALLASRGSSSPVATWAS